MPQLIGTGQIDLGSLKEFLLRPNSESLSGSANNITGFYPYSGNPSGFVDCRPFGVVLNVPMSQV